MLKHVACTRPRIHWGPDAGSRIRPHPAGTPFIFAAFTIAGLRTTLDESGSRRQEMSRIHPALPGGAEIDPRVGSRGSVNENDGNARLLRL